MIIHTIKNQFRMWKGLPPLQNRNIFEAVMNNNMDEFKFFLRSGIPKKRRDGLSILHYLLLFYRKDMLQLLLRMGVDVAVRDKYGHTPLMSAMHQDDLEFSVLEKLAKTDINAVDKDNWTALMHACLCGHLTYVSFLLNKGADIHVKAGDSEWAFRHKLKDCTAYEIAAYGIAQRRHIEPELEILKLLLAHGAEPTSKACYLAKPSLCESPEYDFLCHAYEIREQLELDRIVNKGEEPDLNVL